jgi:hypothetical protein
VQAPAFNHKGLDMGMAAKTKTRIRRHLRSAFDALNRASDGLDTADYALAEDQYVRQQLTVAQEAVNMAAAILHDYQTEAAEREDAHFKEG